MKCENVCFVLVHQMGQGKANSARTHKPVSDTARKIMQEMLWADIEVYKFVKERFYLQLAEARKHQDSKIKTTGSCGYNLNTTDMSHVEYERTLRDIFHRITWSEEQQACIKDHKDPSVCRSLIYSNKSN